MYSDCFSLSRLQCKKLLEHLHLESFVSQRLTHVEVWKPAVKSVVLSISPLHNLPHFLATSPARTTSLRCNLKLQLTHRYKWQFIEFTKRTCFFKSPYEEWVNVSLMKVLCVCTIIMLWGKSAFHVSLKSLSIILNYKVGPTTYVSRPLS